MLYVSKRTKNVFSDRFNYRPTANVTAEEVKPEVVEVVKPIEEAVIEIHEEIIPEKKSKKGKKNNEENIEVEYGCEYTETSGGDC